MKKGFLLGSTAKTKSSKKASAAMSSGAEPLTKNVKESTVDMSPLMPTTDSQTDQKYHIAAEVEEDMKAPTPLLQRHTVTGKMLF